MHILHYTIYINSNDGYTSYIMVITVEKHADLIQKIMELTDDKLSPDTVEQVIELVGKDRLVSPFADDEVPTVSKLLSSQIDETKQHNYAHILPNAVFFDLDNE